MSGKKKSPTKKTAQEIREMIALLEEAGIMLTDYSSGPFGNERRRLEVEADVWQARANKLIGEPK